MVLPHDSSNGACYVGAVAYADDAVFACYMALQAFTITAYVQQVGILILKRQSAFDLCQVKQDECHSLDSCPLQLFHQWKHLAV